MNMRKREVSGVMGMVVLMALVGSTSCVSKKVYQQHEQETDARIKGVESGVEANEKRTTDLARDTDSKVATVRSTAERAVEIGNSAMTRAESAEKLAKGKVLWTTTLSDDSVKFSFDGAKLPETATSVLDDLANKVKGLDKTVYLEIEGHTDNIGSSEYNEQLGLKRAEAVRSYLADKGGLPLHAMNIISYGETKPVAENKTKDGRSKNRRVVIRVLE